MIHQKAAVAAEVAFLLLRQRAPGAVQRPRVLPQSLEHPLRTRSAARMVYVPVIGGSSRMVYPSSPFPLWQQGPPRLEATKVSQ